MTDPSPNHLPPSLTPRMIAVASRLQKRDAMAAADRAAVEAEARALITEYGKHELVAEQVALLKSLLVKPSASSPHSFFNS